MANKQTRVFELKLTANTKDAQKQLQNVKGELADVLKAAQESDVGEGFIDLVKYLKQINEQIQSLSKLDGFSFEKVFGTDATGVAKEISNALEGSMGVVDKFMKSIGAAFGEKGFDSNMDKIRESASTIVDVYKQLGLEVPKTISRFKTWTKNSTDHAQAVKEAYGQLEGIDWNKILSLGQGSGTGTRQSGLVGIAASVEDETKEITKQINNLERQMNRLYTVTGSESTSGVQKGTSFDAAKESLELAYEALSETSPSYANKYTSALVEANKASQVFIKTAKDFGLSTDSCSETLKSIAEASSQYKDQLNSNIDSIVKNLQELYSQKYTSNPSAIFKDFSAGINNALNLNPLTRKFEAAIESLKAMANAGGEKISQSLADDFNSIVNKLDEGETDGLQTELDAVIAKYQKTGEAAIEAGDKVEKTNEEITRGLSAGGGDGTVTQEQYDALKKKLDETAESAKQLQEQLNESGGSKEDFSQLTTELKEAEENLTSLKKELDSLKNTSIPIEQYTEISVALRGAEEEVKELRTELAEISSGAAISGSGAIEMQQEIMSLTDENMQLNASLAKSRHEVESLTSELKRQEDEINDLYMRLKEYSNELSTLDVKDIKNNAEIKSLTTALDTAKKESEQLKQELEQLKVSSAPSDAIAQMEGKVTSLEDSLKKANSELKAMTSSAKALEEQNNKLNEELTQSESGRMYWADQYYDSVNTVKQQEKEIDSLNGKLEATQQLLSSVSSSGSGLSEEQLQSILQILQDISSELQEIGESVRTVFSPSGETTGIQQMTEKLSEFGAVSDTISQKIVEVENLGFYDNQNVLDSFKKSALETQPVVEGLIADVEKLYNEKYKGNSSFDAMWAQLKNGVDQIQNAYQTIKDAPTTDWALMGADSLTYNLKSITSSMEDVSQEASVAGEQVAKMSLDIGPLTEVLNRLTEALEKVVTTFDQLKVNVTTTEFDAAKQKIHDLEQEVTNLQDQLSSKNMDASGLESTVEKIGSLMDLSSLTSKAKDAGVFNILKEDFQELEDALHNQDLANEDKVNQAIALYTKLDQKIDETVNKITAEQSFRQQAQGITELGNAMKTAFTLMGDSGNLKDVRDALKELSNSKDMQTSISAFNKINEIFDSSGLTQGALEYAKALSSIKSEMAGFEKLTYDDGSKLFDSSRFSQFERTMESAISLINKGNTEQYTAMEKSLREMLNQIQKEVTAKYQEENNAGYEALTQTSVNILQQHKDAVNETAQAYQKLYTEMGNTGAVQNVKNVLDGINAATDSTQLQKYRNELAAINKENNVSSKDIKLVDTSTMDDVEFRLKAISSLSADVGQDLRDAFNNVTTSGGLDTFLENLTAKEKELGVTAEDVGKQVVEAFQSFNSTVLTDSIQSKGNTFQWVEKDAQGILTEVTATFDKMGQVMVEKLNVDNIFNSSYTSSWLKTMKSDLTKTINDIISEMGKLMSMDAGSASYSAAEQRIQELLNKYQELANTLGSAADTQGFTDGLSKMFANFGIKVGQEIDNIQGKINSLWDSLDVGQEQSMYNQLNQLFAALEQFNNADSIDGKLSAMKELQILLPGLTSELDGYVQAQKEEAQATKEAAEAESVLTRSSTLSNNIQTWMKENTAAAEQFKERLDEVLKSLEGNSDPAVLKKATEEFKNIQSEAKNAGVATNSFGKSLAQAALYAVGLGSTMQAFNKIVSSIKEAVSIVIELDSAMAQLQIVTGATESEMNQFLESSISLAKELGQSVTDVLGTIETFSRLGYNLEDASTLTEYASILSNVADVDIEDATTGLTSIVKAYGYAADDAEQIADILITVGQNYAISAEEIMTALEKSGSALSATDLSLEKSVALLAAANSSIQDASSVGVFCAHIKNGYIG